MVKYYLKTYGKIKREQNMTGYNHEISQYYMPALRRKITGYPKCKNAYLRLLQDFLQLPERYLFEMKDQAVCEYVKKAIQYTQGFRKGHG